MQRPRVLVLTDPSRAPLLRAHAANATVLTDTAALGELEGGFDAALVDGVLEDEPWDRWVLQRIHRLLRLDAPILIVVPPLMSLVSAVDVRFLTYAARQVLLRAVLPWRPEFELPGPVHRRYHLPRLVRKLDSVGYTAIEPGPGWRGGTPIHGPGLARRATVMARKTSSLSGVAGRSWPDPELARKRYASQHAAIVALRENWLARFPELRGLRARALNPSEWRSARVLVLAPHPDDELIGCGGTLCRLRAAGAEAAILLATDGSRLESLRELPPPRRKMVRHEEARRVAAALGARLFLWREEDARLRCSPENVAKLAGVINLVRPTHIFTPFLGDGHADHRALSQILRSTLSSISAQPKILQYEVWGLVPANLYCDITEEAETLEELLLLYERAMQVEDFVHFCESRNLSRALELMGRPGYAEAFFATTSLEYRRLAERSAR
jgi:LmbE family N-acetylglucosaminyl deacetylase